MLSPEEEQDEEDEDDMLVDGDLENEIQEKLASVDVEFPAAGKVQNQIDDDDRAAYEIPSDDSVYEKVL